MQENNQGITTLHELLDYDARSFTSAEVALKNNIPGWRDKANSLMLKTVLQKYLDFVNQHIDKMESFFSDENITSLRLDNRVMQAFIDETKERLANCEDAEVKDACLLACIQAINHFKISTYGTAASFAKTLGMEKYALVFHEAEVNEKQIDDRLSQLAEFEINRKANMPFSLTE
jgi:ferritin-like metal-binding protein YciE